MGFQALLVREDYYGILKKTLQRYYNQRFGEGIEVGYEPKEGAAELLMNPRLGMIFEPYPPRVMRNYIYRSYDIRGNMVKNLAAKAFVFVSTHTRSLFTIPKKLYIYPSSMVKKETMIAYLNRSIRIFDFKEGTTVSIQKDSFTSKFFQNQLQYRIKNKYGFIPPITAYGDDWFEERILEGKSLARETDSAKYKEGAKTSLSKIIALAKATTELKNTKEYVEETTNTCNSLLSKAKDAKGIITFDRSITYLKRLSAVLLDAPSTVQLADSHGDLQAGNVWLEKEKAWIIDWETYDKRSIWFDTTTLLFGTRYYGGVKKLVESIEDSTLKQTLLQGQHCDWDVRQMVALFLLEDLLFYLEDMMELPGQSGKDTFDLYMNELEEIDWSQVFR